MIASVPFSALRLVVFDLDGTLYPLEPMQKAMRKRVMKYYLPRPHRAREVQAVKAYRKFVKNSAGQPVAHPNQTAFEFVMRASGLEEAEAKRVIDLWMVSNPADLLQSLRFAGVLEIFEHLKAKGITTAVYSDYPAEAKCASLGVEPDHVVSSFDPNVGAFKPLPNGLKRLEEETGISPEQTLFIGDKPELDGACAKAAGCHFLAIENADPDFFIALKGSFK